MLTTVIWEAMTIFSFLFDALGDGCLSIQLYHILRFACIVAVLVLAFMLSFYFAYSDTRSIPGSWLVLSSAFAAGLLCRIISLRLGRSIGCWLCFKSDARTESVSTLCGQHRIWYRSRIDRVLRLSFGCKYMFQRRRVGKQLGHHGEEGAWRKRRGSDGRIASDSILKGKRNARVFSPEAR